MWCIGSGLLLIFFFLLCVAAIVKTQRFYIQFKAAVIDCFSLEDNLETGDLQQRLAKKGHKLNLATFYHCMALLEDEGYVVHWDDPEIIDDVLIKRRWYSLRPGVNLSK